MAQQKPILVKIDIDIFEAMEADIAKTNVKRWFKLKRNRYINDAIRHFINSRAELF